MKIDLKLIPEDILELAQTLKKVHVEAYLVGGAVRDLLMGREPHDYDIASNADPDFIMKVFSRVYPLGVKFGMVAVVTSTGRQVEITQYRGEGEYTDGRHPDRIVSVDSIEQDLSRRDLTINAMALDPITGELVDPFGGAQDIQSKIIRAVGDPQERFEEDGLRAMRVVRFASQLGFSVEPLTQEAIQKTLHKVTGVSMERITQELEKLLLSRDPLTGLEQMQKTGLLGVVLPELQVCAGVEQPQAYHIYDVLTHIFHVVAESDIQGLSTDEALALRFAALLHDVAKPTVKGTNPRGEICFWGHDEESAKVAEQILRRLKLPKKVIDQAVHLIQTHMISYDPKAWSKSAIRKFVYRVGETDLELLLRLYAADLKASKSGSSQLADQLRDAIERLEQESGDMATSVTDLAIDGNDLKKIGIPSGPGMGAILKKLMNIVLEDPGKNTKETLLQIASTL